MASTQYLSKITLYKAVPFDNSYQHSLRATDFNTKKEWLDANFVKREVTNIMYPKIDTTTGKGSIRLEIYDALAEAYNYACIQDDHAHNRFCFILGCRYINDGQHENVATKSVYEFDLELDVVMTFLLHPNQYYAAPIERHHAGSINFTNLRVAENLPIGEYEQVGNVIFCQEEFKEVYGVMVYTPKLDDDSKYPSTMYMNRFMDIPNGAKFKLFDIMQLQDVVDTLSSGDDREIETPSQIIAIYTVPKCMILDRVNPSAAIFPYNGHYVRDLTDVRIKESTSWYPFGNGPTFPTIPAAKNKKINMYPYNFAKLYNDKGNSIEIRYEDWGNGRIKIEYNATMPVSSRATVDNYNGIHSGMIGSTYVDALNYEKSVEISNYPLGCCSSDSYAAFIAQNGRSMETAQIGTGLAMVGALAGVLLAPSTAGASLAAIGGITAGLSSIMSTASKIQSAQDAPDTTQGSIANGNIEYRYHRKVFKIYTMKIKKEFLDLIDSYFTKYGYAQGGITQKPDDALRDYYVYIKTMSSCVKPINNISEPNNNQLNALNIAFINGITLWNPQTTTKDNIMQYDTLDNGFY